MGKVRKGQKLKDFTYDTPFEQNVKFSKTVKRVKHETALVFLRYYGCPLCQLDIHEYAENYEKITKKGDQILVVLQSDPVKLAEQIGPDDLPFDIICDPDRKLYKKFGVKHALTPLGMLGTGTLPKLLKAKKMGFSHGEYEGVETQLPALIVVGQNRKVKYRKYYKSADAAPDADELKKRLKG